MIDTESSRLQPFWQRPLWLIVAALTLVAGTVGITLAATPHTVVHNAAPAQPVAPKLTNSNQVAAEALRATYRQAEHERYMISVYLPDIEMPADSVFQAAAKGDQDAIAKVDHWTEAGTEVNEHGFFCTDLAAAYSRLVTAYIATAAGRNFLAQSHLPTSYSLERCDVQPGDKVPSVPGNDQYYNYNN